MTDYEKQFEKFARDIKFDDSPDYSHRDKLEKKLLNAMAKHSPQQINIWRIIMKSKITKFAVAAVIIAAVVFSVTLLDKSVTTAYAVEQTIEAMRSISSIHAYCTDWDDSKGETWVQIKPETGEEEYYYADQGNLLIVGTPQKTYYYYRDKNLVRIRNEYVPASEVRLSGFFEDMVKWVEQHDGDIEFNSQFEEDLRKEIIIVHVYVPAQGDMEEKEIVFRVDPQTKLPIDMKAIKTGPGEGVKSVDSLEYNVPIPQGLFDFEIPEGAEVVYE